MRYDLMLGLLSTTLLLGCGGAANGTDVGNASAALDSSDATSTESALYITTTDGTEAATSDNEAATMASAGVQTWYQPASCVVSAAVGNVVTYTLTNCTGPWGLTHVSGVATVTYTVQVDGVHAAIAASALSVNGATLSFDSQAVYSVSGSDKQLTVTSDGSGTGARGNGITRKGDYTASWNTSTECATLDGSWSTTVGAAVWSTTVAGYARCKSACPTAGTMTYTGGLSHETLTVSFDGGADATWSSTRGGSGTVVLFCGG
ncbi:MAG TPA: hypothetical protein VIA18_20000 [Polyangia bacterium]|jgi:hypothetical protein|nr:hypothetical protein [Polyangia bacterium]